MFRVSRNQALFQLTIPGTRHTAFRVRFQGSSVTNLGSTETFPSVLNASKRVPLVHAGGQALGNRVGGFRREDTVIEDTAIGRIVVAALVCP